MRGVISQALSLLDQAGGLKDCLPPEIIRQFKLFGLTESIRLSIARRWMHRWNG